MNGMRNAGRGFTLVEVLVALIIVALGSAAMLSALASSARAAERIRERMIAGFVAMNRLTETRLEPEFPGVGRREGEIEMGGSRWAWQEEVVRTRSRASCRSPCVCAGTIRRPRAGPRRFPRKPGGS